MNEQAELEKIVYNIMPNLPYHNYGHMKDVLDAATRYAEMLKLSEKESLLLKIAVIGHDAIFVPDAKDNEEKSAEFTADYMRKQGYDDEDIEKVKGMILATKVPQSPKNYLEKIICDSDLDNLGTDEFFNVGERLRKEYGIKSDRKWIAMQIYFLENHEYHTDIAKKFRQKKKDENLNLLKEIYDELEG